MVYLDTPQALVRWDEPTKTAFIEWRGFADGQDYRNALNTLLEVMTSRGTRKILADTRLSKVITPEDQVWVTTNWMPRAVQAGFKWSALIVPKSALGKMSIDRMVEKLGPDNVVETKYFDDLEKARKWLRSVG